MHGDKMEDRVISVETQIALLQKDLAELRAKTYELPPWFKKSAITVVGMLFLQLSSTIWWAAEITTNLKNIEDDVVANSEFRSKWPMEQSNILISLKEIQNDQKHIESMMQEVKNKLRFVDIQQQHPQYTQQ